MGDWATVLGARPRMGAVGVCCVLGSTGGHSAGISHVSGSRAVPAHHPQRQDSSYRKGSLGQEGPGGEGQSGR